MKRLLLSFGIFATAIGCNKEKNLLIGSWVDEIPGSFLTTDERRWDFFENGQIKTYLRQGHLIGKGDWEEKESYTFQYEKEKSFFYLFESGNTYVDSCVITSIDKKNLVFDRWQFGWQLYYTFEGKKR